MSMETGGYSSSDMLHCRPDHSGLTVSNIPFIQKLSTNVSCCEQVWISLILPRLSRNLLKNRKL